MGYFYTGYNFQKKKYGYFKLGETGKPRLNDRLSQIRLIEKHFECLGYLILHDETQAQRRFVESYARMMMEKEPYLTQVQNDHFIYDITKGRKKTQAQDIANKTLSYAITACEMANIEYEMGVLQFPKKNKKPFTGAFK